LLFLSDVWEVRSRDCDFPDYSRTSTFCDYPDKLVCGQSAAADVAFQAVSLRLQPNPLPSGRPFSSFRFSRGRGPRKMRRHAIAENRATVPHLLLPHASVDAHARKPQWTALGQECLPNLVPLRAGTPSLSPLRSAATRQGDGGQRQRSWPWRRRAPRQFLVWCCRLGGQHRSGRRCVVATRSDGPTAGDELHFFAKKGAFEVRSGKGLIVLRESCQEFAELRYGFGEFGLLVLPVQHDAILHGCEMPVESIGLGRGCGKVCHFTYLIRGSWNGARRFRGQHTMW